MSLFSAIAEKFQSKTDPFVNRVRSLGRIGAASDISQEGTLGYMTGSGYGLIGCRHNCIGIPSEMMGFIGQIFKIHNVPLPDQLYSLVENLCQAALEYVDMYDPYFIIGYSDIKESPDWLKYTYRIRHYGGEVELADPERLEVFQHAPGEDESWYNEFMKVAPNYSMFVYQYNEYAAKFNAENPDRPHQDVSILEEYLDPEFGYWGDQLVYLLENNKDFKDDVYSVCANEDGTLNNKRFSSYLEMIFCSALMWLCSPHAREWREMNHEMFYCCYRYGELLCYDEQFFVDDEYTKIELPPTACHLCGIDAYCVEMVQGVTEDTIKVCNGCASQNRPTLPNATCGSKFCKHIECPHNKHNGLGRKGYFSMMRENENSQLIGMSKGAPSRPMIGPGPEQARAMIGD